MLETFTVAATTFFATISPVDVAAMYAALTASMPLAQRRRIALRAIFIAGGILLLFALIGKTLLSSMGISLAALRTAGGILLLLIGIEMVFARTSGATSTTQEEAQEARVREEIAVFPMATPLIAGPGSMGAVILLMAEAGHDWGAKMAVLSGLFAVLLLTLVALLTASQLHKILGVTGMHVISRVFGVLLSALAVQFIFDGVAHSAWFPH